MGQPKRIYLDYSSTTPVDPRVVKAMLPYFGEKFGNPSSIHFLGREVKGEIEKARLNIARFLNCEEGELFFVGSGTESDNLAIRGVLAQNPKRHLISAKTEHPAVYNTMEFLRAAGYEITYVPVGKSGCVDPGDVRNAIRSDTALISLMHVNNETGSINPLREIGNIAKECGVLFHTDAVQSFGKIRTDLADIHVDLLSASGHKIYGPKGVGLLFVRKGTNIQPVLHGGSQERSLRAGTENSAAIIGLGKAVEIFAEKLDEEATRTLELRALFVEQMKNILSDFSINGDSEHSVPNVVNVSFPGQEGDILLLHLDLKGIAVSSGSACNSGSAKPSRVLINMGIDEQTARSSIRFSFGRYTTEADITYVIETLEEVIATMRVYN